MKSKLLYAGIASIILIAITVGIIFFAGQNSSSFDGERALKDVAYQINLGPRVPGTDAHAKVIDWMEIELEKSGWEVETQETTELGHPIFNIIARNHQPGPWIILCAHYDSRQVADHDPDESKRNQPVPGANDGASGVAVLLEIARVLPKDIKADIWLLFLDAEDQGNLPGWDWILGSTAFVRLLEGKPDAVILLDMIGDADLKIFIERNSTPDLALEVWDVAEKLGYKKYFIAEPGPSLLDDHIPFLRAGIPAIDIIDFNYAYWHTTDDTTDKVSANSLKVVGDTLIHWLELKSREN